MASKPVIKIQPSTFKLIANLELPLTSLIKDADLFPPDAGFDGLNARYAEFEIDFPYCSPFSISAGDMVPRRLEYKDKFIQFAPSPNGLPTVRDADVLIYCTTWIANAALDGRDEDVGSTYEIDVNEFFKFAGRPRKGDRENLFIQGLERLAGSSITTNTKPIGIENYTFNFIEKFVLNRDDAGRLKSVIIELPHTIYCLVHNEFFDPIHPDYFTLSATRRLIYLFLKQYCGNEEKLQLSFAKLHSISGSTSPLRKFLPLIDELVAKQLPEFALNRNPGAKNLSAICIG